MMCLFVIPQPLAWQVVCCAWFALNLLAFVLYGVDKYKSRHHLWRTPESTLLLVALLGGSVGAWLGMRVWHHKTLHRKFRHGVPLILFLQVAVCLYLYSRM